VCGKFREVPSNPRHRYAKQASCLAYVYQILGCCTMARGGYGSGRIVWLRIRLYRQAKSPLVAQEVLEWPSNPQSALAGTP